MKPFIRWVGGKRKLLPDILEVIGDSPFPHYCEPFVGGGAMFFEYGQHCATSMIADINASLMDTYAGIKQNPDLVLEIIRSLKDEPYSAIKHEYNSKPKIAQCRTAALFLMLNHLCFNGLYRVNKQGEFNVPIGKHGSTAAGTNRPRTMDDFPYDAILTASRALQHCKIKASTFTKTMNGEPIGHDTLVFCDPPYLEEFSNYDKNGFNVHDHAALAECAQQWRRQGALVIVCGSDNPASREIYGYPAKVITVNRTVGAGERGKANEALYALRP